MASDPYQLLSRAPSMAEYLELCRAVGWTPFISVDHIEPALQRSLTHVVALTNGRVVGMGRVIGDGAIFFYLQDIAVMPEHQGKRLGTRIMEHLIGWVHANAPRPAHLYLFSATGKTAFYERFGLQPIPNGMYMGLKETDLSDHLVDSPDSAPTQRSCRDQEP